MTDENRPGTLKPQIERTRCVLGKAIHAAAIMRLHELWPDAVVNVKRDVNEFGNRRTTVYIIPEPGRYKEHGSVSCAPGDQFVKATGIQEAFRRALANATKRWHLREEGYENPDRSATEHYV